MTGLCANGNPTHFPRSAMAVSRSMALVLWLTAAALLVTGAAESPAPTASTPTAPSSAWPLWTPTAPTASSTVAATTAPTSTTAVTSTTPPAPAPAPTATTTPQPAAHPLPPPTTAATPQPVPTTVAPAPPHSTAAAPASAAPTEPSATVAVAALASAPVCDAHFEVLNATTQQCDCKRGFSGLGCQMCARDDVCDAAFAPDHTGRHVCAKGLVYRNTSERKTYDCELDESLQGLLTDGALAVHCDRAARNCSAVVYRKKDSLRGEHVIQCALTACAFADGAASGHCGLIECKCGPSCSALTKAIVEDSLSGKPAKISVSNATRLAIEIEDAPIPLSAVCTASACERDPEGGGSGSGSGGGDDGGGSVWSDGVVVVLAVCGALLLALVLGVCCCSCCVIGYGRKLSTNQIEREIAALASMSGRLLEFKCINCRVVDARTQQTKRILSDLSGVAHRGQVLGLLGPSGSGKTSLLNALAAVENGKCQLTGEVRVDGKKIGRNYRRVAAYVQQDDALFSTLTVRECLQYSAQLRLPSTVPEAVKREMVTRIITELNLGQVEHARIGSATSRGVSGGERRRVSIGMELVTSPQILFLDEPTSGLDSSSANSVVQVVKELASHGRIVVMSIHQPSAKAFMLLDQVILLAKGKMLYHGAPHKAKRHFESIGFKCPENENVADFILDIASTRENIPMVRAAFVAKHGGVSPSPISALSERREAHASKSPASSYFATPVTSSESSPFMDAEDGSLDTPRIHEIVAGGLRLPGTPGTPDTPGTPGTPRTPMTPTSSLRSPSSPPGIGSPQRVEIRRPHSSATPSRSIWIELRVLFHRTAINILRHRSLLMLHLSLSIALALFGGLIFNHVTNDLAGFQNRSGAFYFILTFFGFASMSSMDLFIAERGIFLRESGAMYYGPFSYFVAKAVLDTLLLRVLPAGIFASIFYWIMGLQATLAHFAMFQLTLVLFNVAAGSISILVGVLSRNVGTANLSATVVFLVMLLFGGFLLNSQTMPKSVGWIKHFSIFSYAFEILMTNELKGLLLKFDAPGYPSVPVYGDVFLKTLGMDFANRYYDLIALSMIALALQALAFLFLALQVPVRQELVEEDEKYEKNEETKVQTSDAGKEIEADAVKLVKLEKSGSPDTSSDDDAMVDLEEAKTPRANAEVI